MADENNENDVEEQEELDDKLDADSDETLDFDPGWILYDLRLLRTNIEIIREYMHWSGEALINLRPLYPRWIFHIRKLWTTLDHDESFLVLFSMALSLHFAEITFGYGFKFASNEMLYEFTHGQLAVEVTMFILTFLLIFYPPFKCYLYVYFWVCAKGFYWSSIMYSIVVQTNPWWRTIEGPVHLVLDIYVTVAMLVHSLVDYARLSYVNFVLGEILKEEVRIVAELVEQERLVNLFFQDL